MTKFEILLVAFVIFQSGRCEVRDQRHVPTKMNQIKSNILITSKEIEQINQTNEVEKQALENAGLTFIRQGSRCLKHLQRGIIDNSQPNEHGKSLQGYLQTADQFTQWVSGILKKDNPKLQQNLNEAVVKFELFLPLTQSALDNVKESSKNSELATNSISDSVDTALAFFSNLKVHIQHRKVSNSELQGKVKAVQNEALTTLSGLPSDSYNAKELAIHSHQLKHLVQEVSEKVKSLVQTSSQEDKTALEKTAEKLGKIESEIQNKASPNLAFPELLTLYKNWLSEVSQTTIDLDNQTKGHNDAVKDILFDILGIVEFFKTEFEILSGKIH